jgi:DNA-binding PadR family transcriptional regulator
MFRRGFRHGRRPWRDEAQHEERFERGGPHGGHREERREERFERRGPFGGRDAFWFMPRGRGGFGHGPGHGGPFGGDPFGGDPFGGRRRQRRGDIKFALLELVAEQPRHGYELIKELESRYAGFYRPSPGTVYPTLQLLEDEGNLESASENGKRIYTITEAGRKLLAERGSEGSRPGEERGPQGRWRSPELEQLREQTAALSMSVMQAARHGSPEQMRAVRTLLENATREVYGVLASAPTPQDEQS